ncbi:MAG: acyloxyacyl hydrolase [Acidobacteriota bacterium]|nr:acyloxyacyl hydrolase [Acidobacteriota bacterium]
MRLQHSFATTLILCATLALSAGRIASAAPPADPASPAGTPPGAATPAPAPPAPVRVDARAQYPAFLRNSYFDFNVGTIRYLFSAQQLEPGFQAQSTEIPHLAARVDLFGHQFLPHLAAQVVYLRPARYVTYTNVNGDGGRHQVSEAIGAVTLVSSWSLTRRVSVYGEGGYGITSRGGIRINGQTVVKDARFGAALLGAGFAYHLTPNVDLLLSATYSPGRRGLDQPSTRLFTTGFRYHMLPLSAAKVEASREAAFFFPANVVRLGLSSGAPGYGANSFFSSVVPIFWNGRVRADRGVTVDYQHNVFHTRKRFAFDLGASVSSWTSTGGETFRTLSVYPLLRFMLVRTRPADVYATYSLAGPTYLNRSLVDGHALGARFEFQDAMAVGAFLGARRRLNVEIGIKHYSNGNIFPQNAAIAIPVTLTVGLAF